MPEDAAGAVWACPTVVMIMERSETEKVRYVDMVNLGSTDEMDRLTWKTCSRYQAARVRTATIQLNQPTGGPRSG